MRGGGACEGLPLRKGERKKVLAMLKGGGGHKQFWAILKGGRGAQNVPTL